jgi:4-amino-4-deoxy-L-arabinose transferase-like glycosyltransferase
MAGVPLLIVFGLLLNLPFFHLREFQGEEGTRVIIAMDMKETGQWIVPRVEGEIYLSKPPLYNWLLAAISGLAGGFSEASARLPSVLFALGGALSLTLFWKGTARVGTLWVILPGIIFLTFPDVLDKAIRAEIDMTFTVLVTLSLILWFYFHEVRQRPRAAWVLSCATVGLSMLTKGMQAPAFFYCAVVAYMITQRQAREIFSWRHLAGILVAGVVVSLWLIPLSKEVELSALVRAWTHEIVIRKDPIDQVGFVRHFIKFPAEYILGYLPWLPFMGLWLSKPLRPKEPVIKKLAWFCLLAALFSVPFYWLLPGARVRYVLPLSGLVALLITIPLHAAIQRKDAEIGWCRWYGKVLGIVIIFAVVSVPFWGRRLELIPGLFTVFCLGGTFLAGAGLLGIRRTGGVVALIASAVLFGKLSWADIYFPYHAAHLSHYRRAAAEINRLVPRVVPIYDFGVSNTHVTFYLDRPVRMIRSLTDIKGKGAVIMTKKNASHMDLDGFVNLGEVKARREVLMVYESPKG